MEGTDNTPTPGFAAPPVKTHKVSHGSGRRGVRKNRHPSAALEALARKREEKRARIAASHAAVLGKIRHFGWTENDAPPSEIGGATVVDVPDKYSVTLFYDPLTVVKDLMDSEGKPMGWDVATTVTYDSEHLKSYFEMPDDSWPAPASFGPWVLRVRYDKEFMYDAMRRISFGMDMHHKPWDAADTYDRHFVVARVGSHDTASNEGAHLDENKNWVIFSDNNCEELFAHIRFTPDEEPTLNALLRDARATGRMFCVDEFLRRNGVSP
jgi:hypothetical protein